MQAPTTRIICDNWDTSFWTVPKRSMNFYKLLCSTIMLPFPNPVFEHLADFSISDWNFLYTKNLQTRGMKHFFNSTRCWLEYSQSYHLIKSDYLLSELKTIHIVTSILLLHNFHCMSIICWETRWLAQQMLFWCVLEYFCQSIYLW